MSDFERAKVDSELDRIDKIDKRDDERISAVRGKEDQLTEVYVDKTKAILAFVDSFGPGDKMKDEVVAGLLAHLQRIDKAGLVRQQKAFGERVDKYFEKINLRAQNPGEVWKMDMRIILETDFTLSFGFAIPPAVLQKFFANFRHEDFEMFSESMKQLNAVAFSSRHAREVMRLNWTTFVKALTLASSGKVGEAVDLIGQIMVKIDDLKDALKPLVRLRQERRAIDAKKDIYFVALRKMHENLKSKSRDADIIRAKDAVEVATAYFVLVESFEPFVGVLQGCKNPNLLMSADPALFAVDIAVIRPGKSAGNGRASMEVFKETLKIPKNLQDFEILRRSAMRVLTAAKAELFLISGEEAYRGDFEKDVDERQKNIDDNGQSILEKAMEADYKERFADGMPVVVKGTLEYEAISDLLKLLSGRQAVIEKLRVSDPVAAFSAANEFFKRMTNLRTDLTGGLKGALTKRETTFILPTELTFFTPANLKLLQGLKAASPRAYGFLMKMLEIHQVKISQIAKDVIVKDPEVLKFQREFGVFMKSGEGLFKTFEDLMQNIQQGKPPTKAEMPIVHKAVDDYVDSPYFKNIRSIWPLEKFRAYEKMAAGKMPGIANTLAGLLSAYDSLSAYIETVGKIAEELKDMSGDMVGAVGFIKDAVKLLLIIGAAVYTGGTLAGAGVSAFGVMSTVTMVSTMSGAALDYLDGNKHAFDPGTLMENYARGLATSYAAGVLSRPVGMLWGNLAKRLNDKLIQSNIGFLRNFAEKGYMVRALEVADDAAEKGGALRKMFTEMTEETAEEGLEAIGQAIAPHDPIVGFSFSLLGSSARHARSAFRKGKFALRKYNVDVQVGDAGIVVEYDPAKADIKGLLKDYGLTDVFADAGSVDTVARSSNGVKVEFKNVGVKAKVGMMPDGEVRDKVIEIHEQLFEHESSVTPGIYERLCRTYANIRQEIVEYSFNLALAFDWKLQEVGSRMNMNAVFDMLIGPFIDAAKMRRFRVGAEVIAINPHTRKLEAGWMIDSKRPDGTFGLRNKTTGEYYDRYLQLRELQQWNSREAEAHVKRQKPETDRKHVGDFNVKLDGGRIHKFSISQSVTLVLAPDTTAPQRINLAVLPDGTISLKVEPGMINGNIILMDVPVGADMLFGRADFGNNDRVSGQHLRIKNLGNGQFELTDWNSTNGTKVESDFKPDKSRVYNIAHEEAPFFMTPALRQLFGWLDSQGSTYNGVAVATLKTYIEAYLKGNGNIAPDRIPRAGGLREKVVDIMTENRRNAIRDELQRSKVPYDVTLYVPRIESANYNETEMAIARWLGTQSADPSHGEIVDNVLANNFRNSRPQKLEMRFKNGSTVKILFPSSYAAEMARIQSYVISAEQWIQLQFGEYGVQPNENLTIVLLDDVNGHHKQIRGHGDHRGIIMRADLIGTQDFYETYFHERTHAVLGAHNMRAHDGGVVEGIANFMGDAGARNLGFRKPNIMKRVGYGGIAGEIIANVKRGMSYFEALSNYFERNHDKRDYNLNYEYGQAFTAAFINHFNGDLGKFLKLYAALSKSEYRHGGYTVNGMYAGAMHDIGLQQGDIRAVLHETAGRLMLRAHTGPDLIDALISQSPDEITAIMVAQNLSTIFDLDNPTLFVLEGHVADAKRYALESRSASRRSVERFIELLDAKMAQVRAERGMDRNTQYHRD